MGSEYVMLSGEERAYGQQELLQSQLDILNCVKHLARYKKLRTEEINLKLTLKAKIESVKDSLDNVEKLLPKTEYQPPKVSVKRIAQHRKELSIEEEIEEIQNKLKRLQSVN